LAGIVLAYCELRLGAVAVVKKCDNFSHQFIPPININIRFGQTVKDGDGHSLFVCVLAELHAGKKPVFFHVDDKDWSAAIPIKIMFAK
jgi:hypothetical protein